MHRRSQNIRLAQLAAGTLVTLALVSIHAASFCARPVIFYTDGMSAQQLQQLEEIQKPIHS